MEQFSVKQFSVEQFSEVGKQFSGAWPVVGGVRVIKRGEVEGEGFGESSNASSTAAKTATIDAKWNSGHRAIRVSCEAV